jgi:hypothetical protein
MAFGDPRQLPQISALTLQQINLALAKLATASTALEGRNGIVTLRDTLKIISDGNLLVDLGPITFNAYGIDRMTMGIAVGCHYDKANGWIADATAALILEASEAGNWKYYKDTGLTVGQPFTPTASGPHPGASHTASEIINVPYGHIASTNVQAALNELDDEKLARDGSQTMLGNLDMNHNNVNNVNNIEVEADATFSGAGAIISPSRIDFTASTPTLANQRVVWDTTERVLSSLVTSGSTVAKLGEGWNALMMQSSTQPGGILVFGSDFTFSAWAKQNTPAAFAGAVQWAINIGNTLYSTTARLSLIHPFDSWVWMEMDPLCDFVYEPLPGSSLDRTKTDYSFVQYNQFAALGATDAQRCQAIIDYAQAGGVVLNFRLSDRYGPNTTDFSVLDSFCGITTWVDDQMTSDTAHVPVPPPSDIFTGVGSVNLFDSSVFALGSAPSTGSVQLLNFSSSGVTRAYGYLWRP